MKVTELFEAYEPPKRNPKLGFRAEKKIPVGGSKEWLKTINATPEHIEQALRVVRQSTAYHRARDLGMRDDSSARHSKNGSMMFVGRISWLNAANSLRNSRMKLTVQPNGKIDETQPNDFHRAPMSTGKPRIVPGDPVGSIAKTMIAAIEKMNEKLAKRRAQEKKDMAKADHKPTVAKTGADDRRSKSEM